MTGTRAGASEGRLTAIAQAGIASLEERRSLVRFATAVVAVLVAIEAVVLVVAIIVPSPYWALGMDFFFYREVGARFLAGEGYYLAHQLAGPYDVTLMVDVLYPPLALFLFVPFVVLPWAAWWVIPVSVTAYCIRRSRPSPLALLAMVVLLAWPRAIGAYLFGNTDIWIVSAIAAASHWGWPIVLLAIKPIAIPLAIPFLRDRRAWIAAAILAVLSLAMLPMWLDYLTAMRGMTIDVGYSLGSIPLYLIPIVAWLGRRRPIVQTASVRAAA